MSIEQILALPKDVQSDIATVLELLYQQKYTGPITLHFHGGIARTVQIPSPQIRLGTPKAAARVGVAP